MRVFPRFGIITSKGFSMQWISIKRSQLTMMRKSIEAKALSGSQILISGVRDFYSIAFLDRSKCVTKKRKFQNVNKYFKEFSRELLHSRFSGSQMSIWKIKEGFLLITNCSPFPCNNFLLDLNGNEFAKVCFSLKMHMEQLV